MHLAIASQDISELILALFDGKNIVQSEVFLVPPEQHLDSLDKALEKWGLSIQDLKGVIVVTGPGSFTASRVSVTLANSLALTQKIPVWGLENTDKRPLGDLLAEVDLLQLPEQGFVLPSYDRPPMITKSA